MLRRFASATTVVLIAIGAAALWSCGPQVSASGRSVVLATTTSVNDSGLLEVLVPDFERRSGYTVKTIAVGSGKALAMGERGEADVLLVHAPSAEKDLLLKGAVTDRRVVMHNYYVLVGPPADPAGIREIRAAPDAMRRIADSGSIFVSRGDDSGTHKMERSLWSAPGQAPSGPWYLESGQGMGTTLVIASEKQGYTLTDLGTFLAFRQQLRLEVMVKQSPALLNLYSVMLVNPERFERVNSNGARAFADYLVSTRTQDLIRGFGVDRFGAPLFIPDAGKSDTDFTG